MERSVLLERALSNCVDFVRQYVYYLHLTKRRDEFPNLVHTYIHNNFICMSVFNWSHAFGHHNDVLHFRNVSTDGDQFKEGLLQCLDLDNDGWKAYWEEMKAFRDKRVAHIDPDPEVKIPDLAKAYKCVSYYYHSFIGELKELGDYDVFPDNLDKLSDTLFKKYDETVISLLSGF